MAPFGEVVLKFGTMGEAGEPPLRFNTGHINLLVGPNNAGKSLMLREISGVNPRETRRRSHKIRYSETRIVASVGWSEETARAIKQDILEMVFEGEERVFPEIKPQPWESLISTLEQAVKRLTELRDNLSSTLLGLLKSSVDEPFARFINQAGIDWEESGPLLIVGGVVVLVLARMTAQPSDDNPAGLSPLAQPENVRSVLPAEQVDALQQTLEASWKSCQEVFGSLGVESTDLTIESLFNVKSLAGVLVKKASEIPGIGQFILQDPRITQLPEPDAETVRRFERYVVLGGWLLDPTRLDSFRKELQDTYASHTWADLGQRGKMAKSVLYLDGLARLEMTRSVTLRAYDEEAEDDPPVLSLLKKPDVMRLLRNMVASALGRHLVIDIATQAPQVIWRLAEEEPRDGVESSFSKAATDYHSRAALLEERSDGIHAFIGMLAAILAKNSDAVFIDEPEAFLHPPLVRKLARQLVFVAKKLDAQFFIATHSADLVESCAAVGADVNIIRLTHNNGRSTARLLDSASLRQLALDPLLRAESTLSALFHEGAVVCEAVADRVLYREVNERLLLSGDDGGLESCMFLNAQNWQTVARMIAPLRKMGVAAAAVLDADVLFGAELGTILEAAQVPRILRESWLQQRGKLKEKLIKRLQPPGDKIEFKGDTIAKLKGDELKVFESLCANMANYGVFLVPVGELEDWLSSLGLKRSSEKLKWLRAALDRMGVDPEVEGYARPTDDDIWQFVRTVNRWIVDPDREGTSPTPHQDD